MSINTLTWYYEHPEHVMLTAHRGASYEFPENTILAMEKALEAGADMIEFDVTSSKDGVPVILHDRTIDRTSNGKGYPKDFSLAELKQLNFSYWLQDQRRTAPAYENVTIPSFQEMLEAFHNCANMNIQLHGDVDDEGVIRKICELFVQFNMFDHAYLTVCPPQADLIMSLYPAIEMCVTPPMRERAMPEKLHLCKEKYHCRFVQPVSKYVTQESFDCIKQLQLRDNVFFSDDIDEAKSLLAMGATGIMTNKIHLLKSEF